MQTPEKERSSFNVEEPTLTLTPLNVSSRKGEIDTVEPEEIIDCEVKKTDGINKCDDCDFQTDVETEMENHTQIKHIDPTEGCHCEKCNLTLDTNDSLKSHLRRARCKVHVEGVLCEKCNITFTTNEHLKKHIQFNHALGPKCHLHSKKRQCREDPRSCHHYRMKDNLYSIIKDKAVVQLDIRLSSCTKTTVIKKIPHTGNTNSLDRCG